MLFDTHILFKNLTSSTGSGTILQLAVIIKSGGSTVWTTLYSPAALLCSYSNIAPSVNLENETRCSSCTKIYCSSLTAYDLEAYQRTRREIWQYVNFKPGGDELLLPPVYSYVAKSVRKIDICSKTHCPLTLVIGETASSHTKNIIRS